MKNFVVGFDLNLVYDDTLSDQAMFVYSFFKSQRFPRNVYTVSSEGIMQSFFGENVCQSTEKAIRNGIQELLDRGIIDDVTIKNGNLLSVSVGKLYEPSKDFLILDYADVWEKFLKINVRTRYRLYRFYLEVLSTFDVNYRNTKKMGLFGRWKPDTIAERFGLTKDTYERYMDTLYKNKILYRFCSRPVVDRNNLPGIVFKRPSIYCRYEDKDECDAFIDLNHNIPEFSSYNTSSWDKPVFPQAAAQIYSRIAKGEEYPYDKVKEVYMGVVAYNLSVAEYGDPYRPRSLDCFKRYDFYNAKDEFERQKVEAEDRKEREKEKRCSVPASKRKKKRV